MLQTAVPKRADEVIQNESVEQVSSCPEVGLRALYQIEDFDGELLGAGYRDVQTGLIVTAYHVVKDKTAIFVRDTLGARRPARILTRDKRRDLSIVVDSHANDAPAGLPLEGLQPRIGELVWSFGHPGGYIGSVSKGVVSAVDRELSEADTSIRYIQIDAATFEGSSGGPVLNARCKVVGIVSRGTLRGLISFLVPASDIYSALLEAQSKGVIGTGYFEHLV